MTKVGKVALLESGKRGLRPSGKASAFDHLGQCNECCKCTPAHLASYGPFYTAPGGQWNPGNLPPPIDLATFQGPGVATGGEEYWSLMVKYGIIAPWPVGEVLSGYYISLRGCVGDEGELIGLPATFYSGVHPSEGLLAHDPMGPPGCQQLPIFPNFIHSVVFQTGCLSDDEESIIWGETPATGDGAQCDLPFPC